MLFELYRAALPSVRDEPLGRMPRTLYGYVLKASAGQQVRLCLLTVLVFPLTLAPLELQRRIVDGAIEGGDLRLLLGLGGLYLAAALLRGGLKFLRNVYVNRVGEGVARLLRRRMVGGAAASPGADEGTVQTILSAEAEKAGGFVAESVAFPLLQGGVILSVAVYMLAVEPLIAAVVFAWLVPALGALAATQPLLNRLSERKITATRALGQAVLRDRRPDASAASEADGLIERIYGLRLRFANVKHAVKAVNNLANHLGPLSVLMVGGWLAIRGETEIGTIVAFLSGYERMTGPARELMNFYRRLSLMRVQYRLVHEAGRPGAG